MRLGHFQPIAALDVFGTGSLWPDVIVAAVMSGLGISGITIMRQAAQEIRQAQGNTILAAERS